MSNSVACLLQYDWIKDMSKSVKCLLQYDWIKEIETKCWVSATIWLNKRKWDKVLSVCYNMIE